MKTIDDIITAIGRFAVGLAIGVALTSACVIATEDVAETRPSADAMAAGSSRATAAATDEPAVAPDRLHVYGRGAQRV